MLISVCQIHEQIPEFNLHLLSMVDFIKRRNVEVKIRNNIYGFN